MDYSISQMPNPKESLVFIQEEKPAAGLGRVNIFDHFSDQSLQIVVEASNLAKSTNGSYVYPAHMLIVLLGKKNITASITPDKIALITEFAHENLQSKEKGIFKGSVFLTPEFKKLLIASFFVAKQNSATVVDGMHLLLALSSYHEFAEKFASVGFIPVTLENFYLPNSLGEYATDLTNAGSNDPRDYSSRDAELNTILRIFSRESKHNVVLLGEEGVGKSVIALGLAKFINNKKLDSFLGVKVINLNVGFLFSLTKPGKTLAQNLIDAVSPLSRVIFYLENTNQLTASVQISQFMDFLQTIEKKANVNFLLPATPSYYREVVTQNPYLLDNFDIVQLNELNETETKKILEAESGRIEKYYKVSIAKDVFDETVALAKRYLPGKLPQKAIALLEEVSAGSFLSKNPEVKSTDVRDVVAQKTGVPIHSLTEPEMERLKNLEELLAQYVVGQKEALLRVSEALRRARAGLKDNKKPIGSFLFLGPTGVGKTELAKSLAKLFFNDEKSFLRFDMSEYAESFTAQRLIGSPPGYVGYEEGGQLTNQVSAHPYSLILFDEIEKAHPRVFDLFLQILDDGRLTDSKGTVVDFRNTLIIFTSNIASREIFENSKYLSHPDFDKQKFVDGVIMPIVRNYFRPELVNRFDDIIMFNPLTKEELIKIARLKVMQLQSRLKDKNIDFEISDEKLAELVEDSFDPSFGARPLEREIREKVENPLAKKIISGEIKDGDKIEW